MKVTDSALLTFFQNMEISLPGLRDILKKTKNDVFLLGAGVFELYASCGWCEDLSRSTSDLDFSLEIIGDSIDYLMLSTSLQSAGYKRDKFHPYRYNSPSKLGRFVYVDLLTFTTDAEIENRARSLMGVGENFSFLGMGFAKQSPLLLEANIFAPNPLAFIYLKMIAYRENPDKRLKDFGDIFEFIVGAVKKDAILSDLRTLAQNSRDKESTAKIQRMVKEVAEDSSPSWDYDQVENQLLQRPPLEIYSQEDFQTFFNFFLNEVFL